MTDLKLKTKFEAMRILAFIRAMRWKGLIITAVVTAIAGLMLTLYSCKPADRKMSRLETEVHTADAKTLPDDKEVETKEEVNCTATACVIE